MIIAGEWTKSVTMDYYFNEGGHKRKVDDYNRCIALNDEYLADMEREKGTP